MVAASKVAAIDSRFWKEHYYSIAYPPRKDQCIPDIRCLSRDKWVTHRNDHGALLRLEEIVSSAVGMPVWKDKRWNLTLTLFSEYVRRNDKDSQFAYPEQLDPLIGPAGSTAIIGYSAKHRLSYYEVRRDLESPWTEWNVSKLTEKASLGYCSSILHHEIVSSLIAFEGKRPSERSIIRDWHSKLGNLFNLRVPTLFSDSRKNYGEGSQKLLTFTSWWPSRTRARRSPSVQRHTARKSHSFIPRPTLLSGCFRKREKSSHFAYPEQLDPLIGPAGSTAIIGYSAKKRLSKRRANYRDTTIP